MGLEPTTFRLEGGCAILLRYEGKLMYYHILWNRTKINLCKLLLYDILLYDILLYHILLYDILLYDILYL